MPTFQITDCFGEQVTLQPRLGLYSVTDFGGQEMPGLAIILDRLGSTPEETEQYAVLTTSFGEFIGAKDCAYIDTNNCYFAPQLLEQGFAENTGLTKSSGFCQYPLWHFKEDFLREIGGEVYEQYGKPTSIEPVITADGGAAVNEDRSKNAALVPPAFGSPSAYALNTGTYLTPNLAPGGMAATGAVINGGTAAVVTPGTPITSTPPSSGSSSSSGTVGYTEVTEDLYYSGGYLATLKIPALDLSVKVYQGTDSATLRKGVGHFEETSIWSGNTALAAHNRGVNDYFGEIHTLDIGDKIQYTTKLGTRIYRVTSVEKISETDRSSLTPTTENCLTLYTCVRDQSAYRWCVRAVEV